MSTTEITIPKSPEDMPMAFHNDAEAIRTKLLCLDSYAFVNIIWERDDSISSEIGEPVGTWHIEINTAGQTIIVHHPEFSNALWFACEKAEHINSEEWKKRERTRLGALAKLTAEERKILGI